MTARSRTHRRRRRLARVTTSRWWVRAWFIATLFVSAFLLFTVQPLFAKMVLPLLGGTPAVWNTCMVFFQAALLLGYLYAHVATVRWPLRTQLLVHSVVLLVPLLLLPIRIPAGWQPPVDANPIPWLLQLLALGVGLPFMVVATSAPLLQRWFAQTRAPGARDPYFLYAASNAGSLLSLLSYPTLIEPSLHVPQQSNWWTALYGVLALLIGGCAWWVWRAAPERATVLRPPQSQALPWGRRLRWVALAAVPSSLMLGVTTYFSTDIAAIPLLWVIPLALYLGSFVLVFARRPPIPHAWLVRGLPFVVIPLTLVIAGSITQPMWLLMLLHLGFFFIATMVCHGELAQDRPAPDRLTEFYLWMSVGGMVGGCFNALIAPVAFSTVMEYPIAILLACLLRPGTPSAAAGERRPLLDYLLPMGVALLVIGFRFGVIAADIPSRAVRLGVALGPALLMCFMFRYHQVRFGLGIGAVLLTSSFLSLGLQHLLHVERTFFGVYRVVVNPTSRGVYRELHHGTTLHGMQSVDPARRREPLSYFHRQGPVGTIFEAFSGAAAKRRVAVIGLGTGTLGCYAQPGQDWTFYEIDPAVLRIASNRRLFTFLTDIPTDHRVVLGDARLSFVRAPARAYELLLIDAFSSDAIPIHLLTREAIELYLEKLTDDGVIAFHISNRYLRLAPVLGDIAGGLGLVCLSGFDRRGSPSGSLERSASHWVVLARNRAALGALAGDKRWETVMPRPGARMWSDDYSNLLRVFRWK